MSAARTLTDADVEAIVAALAERLGASAPKVATPAPARVPVTDRHRKMAADYLSRPKKIRHTR